MLPTHRLDFAEAQKLYGSGAPGAELRVLTLPPSEAALLEFLPPPPKAWSAAGFFAVSVAGFVLGSGIKVLCDLAVEFIKSTFLSVVC